MRWLFVLAVLALSGCIVLKHSPAPGCMRYLGSPPMGGCFGKNVITGLNVEPRMECLRVTANNCNGGVLVFENRCENDLTVGGYMVKRGPHPVTLDFARDTEGVVYANHTGGNFALYTPKNAEVYSVSGTLGSTGIMVSYNKTGPLC